MKKKINRGVRITMTLTKKQSDEINRLRRRLGMNKVDYTQKEVNILLK